MKNIVQENMMKHEIVQAKDPTSEVWSWPEGSLKSGPYAQLSVKVSHMHGGKLHFQFTCADVEGLHSDMAEELRRIVQSIRAVRVDRCEQPTRLGESHRE